MTKGQCEAKISEAISRFEIDHMGRGPEQIKSYILQDMIVVRLKGFLSHAERKLAVSKDGVELLKRVRTMLFEENTDLLERTISDIVSSAVTSMHSDVSTRTGEKVIIFTVQDNLEERFQTRGGPQQD